MRTKDSILNITSNFIITLSKTILTFVVRTVFIKTLGAEILGLNGLLINILSMLSLAELGISTAINFSLYKPIANNDIESISKLMSFYKKAYRVIGYIISLLGLILMFFLDYFIKDYNNIENLYITYLLFLLNTVSTYFISYKETLITADQKSYKLTIINFLSIITMNILQIIFLIFTKNYIMYLIIQFIAEFIRRILVNRYITKKYNNINFLSKEKLNQEDKDTLISNVKAMFFHKIGDYCVNSTDNLIISKIIGILTVGIYSNYLTVINMVNTFITLIYSSITASFGNLVATETVEKRLQVFNKINFVGYIIYGTCSLIFINIFNIFINIWIGKDYLLDINVVILIVINFYLSGMRVPLSTAKNAAGIYRQDKYVPIIQAFINLFISIILAKYIGLIGILIGTFISNIFASTQRPYVVFKYVFKKSTKEYYISYLKNVTILLIAQLLITYTIRCLHLEENFITMIIIAIITIIIYLVLNIIIYHNKEEYKYIRDIVKKILKKIVFWRGEL